MSVTKPSPEEVTHLLVAWSKGDGAALHRLMPLVYRELHGLARRRLRREDSDHTLQTTALVNEAYLRLVGQKAQWQNRAHFYAIAAQMMRRVLVDYARSRHYAKRGGGALSVSFDERLVMPDERSADVLALDQALIALAEIDERKSKIVELRFFGGLSVEESALVVGVSPGTVRRDWTLAKAWLKREMARPARPTG
jgi:RNA polymerase sigma factor (TIGR02999 family)